VLRSTISATCVDLAYRKGGGGECDDHDQEQGIYLFAYDCQLNFLWRAVHPFPNGFDPINFGVADFDSERLVEIYAKDEVYDAKTGTRLIKSTAANYQRINGGPVAVNMLGTVNWNWLLA